MITNESASVLVEVARGYVQAQRRIPALLQCDLTDVANCDEGIDPSLRFQARQLLGLEGNAA